MSGTKALDKYLGNASGSNSTGLPMLRPRIAMELFFWLNRADPKIEWK